MSLVSLVVFIQDSFVPLTYKHFLFVVISYDTKSNFSSPNLLSSFRSHQKKSLLFYFSGAISAQICSYLKLPLKSKRIFFV